MKHVLTIAQVVWLDLLRKKDLYVLFILLAALLLALVSLNIFGISGSTNYIKDIGLMMIWLFGLILGVSVTARQLPTEESHRTIFPLLAKPLTRAELIVGKWLGAWSIVAAATAVFYLLTTLIVMGMGGHIGLAAIVQAFVLHAVALGVICAFTLFFSTRLNSDAACTLSYVLSAASFLVVPRIPEFLAQQSGISANLLLFLYHILPHFEVFDMRRRVVHEYGPLPATPFITVLLYGTVLIIALLVMAWLAYRNKRFSRGNLQ